MLGLKLNHVSKRGHSKLYVWLKPLFCSCLYVLKCILLEIKLPTYFLWAVCSTVDTCDNYQTCAPEAGTLGNSVTCGCYSGFTKTGTGCVGKQIPWTENVMMTSSKWNHFLRYWPFVHRIHRSPVNSPHKGQRRGALMFSLNCVWVSGWMNNREAGDFRRHHTHYDVNEMVKCTPISTYFE